MSKFAEECCLFLFENFSNTMPPRKRQRKKKQPRPWIKKYQPRTLRHFVGNKANVATLRAWILSFQQRCRDDGDRATRCVVLSGPYGIGKTTLVHLLAAQCGYSVVTLNAASRDNRRAFLDSIHTTLHPTTLQRHLKMDSKPKLLLIEEINAIVSSGKGSAELKTLLEQLHCSHRPLVCITDSRGEEGIRRLVQVAARVEMTLPDANAISAHLALILAHEKRSNQHMCDAVAVACQGNMRQAIMRLQCSHNLSTTLTPITDQGCSQRQGHTATTTYNVHMAYTRFYDAYGHHTLFHALEHYTPSRGGKKRGRKPTKKSCYANNDKTTVPLPQVCALHGVEYWRNLATVSAALVEAEHLRAYMARDHDDLETECVDELVPYLAYFSCGVSFKLSPVAIPLDRVDCPSHASTCKRYVSDIRSLLAHIRSTLYDGSIFEPPHTALLANQNVFCAVLFASLKRILSEPLAQNKMGLHTIIRYVKRFALTIGNLEFIYKCATYSGQRRIGRELDRDDKDRLQMALEKLA